MIISILYSGGLRKAELLNLKLNDIQSDRGLLRINGGKGKKIDLQFYLSYSLSS